MNVKPRSGGVFLLKSCNTCVVLYLWREGFEPRRRAQASSIDCFRTLFLC